jgi:PAS domain S-box-containing protein
MSLRSRFSLLAAFALAVLAMWRQIDLGVAASGLWVIVIFLAYLSRSARAVWIAATGSSLLAIAGVSYGPDTGQDWRLILSALFAIWAPAYPCARALSERAERERLDGIVNWSGDAILSRTLDGTITSWNLGAETLYGYRREEIVGRSHTLLVPPERQDELQDSLERLKNGEPVIQYETERIRKGRQRVEVSITVSPIHNTEGELVGAATIARDVTKRNRLAAIQRRMGEQLEERVQRRTAQLARANEALERSNLDLQQFAYIASHDLQTPLRAIAGFAQFLQADYADRLDETAQDYLDRIVRGASRLQELIEDLLQFSRVESNPAPLGPVELDQVFDDAVEALQVEVDASSANVSRTDLPQVQGDAQQLTHLFQNLIENAIKYRRADPPEVQVSAERDAAGWVVSVSDNGIGIAPQYRERVFEIFRRLHSAQAYPGTGIGLSLCRRIVNRFGGRIWVDSEEGKGSSFRFTIPDEPAPNRHPGPASEASGDHELVNAVTNGRIK